MDLARDAALLSEPDRLFIYDRWRRLVSFLKPDAVTSVEELSAALAVSPATIRRDLAELDADGQLKRVRGGAVSTAGRAVQPAPGLSLRGQMHQSLSMVTNMRAKIAIGTYAAKMVADGEAVIIDGGTTTLQMAEQIGDARLTVLTTSVLIMNALFAMPNVRVVIAGGEIFREQSIILDPYGGGIVSKYSASKLFIGAQALSPRGLLQTDPLLVQNEQALIERSDQIIVLADSSKFEARGSMAVCGLDRIDVLITDEDIKPAHRALLESHEIDVVTVPISGP
jgi:DeoR family ulaG and ulaABCDEF operon transcriptional repressor